jgi:hypothetical protein
MTERLLTLALFALIVAGVVFLRWATWHWPVD